jgi:hypothetical protein
MWPAEQITPQERLRRVKEEVERRRVLREKQDVDEANARRVIREHESGAKKATEAQLAAARAVIRGIEDRRGPMKPDASASVVMPDADMQTVAKAWQQLFADEVAISDRAKTRTVSFKVSATSRDELRSKVVSALRENGIYVITRPNGIVLDTEPEAKKE